MKTTNLELKLCEIRHDLWHNKNIPLEEVAKISEQLNEAIGLVKNLAIHDVVVAKRTLCKCKKEFTVYNDREGLNVCTLCGESKLA